MCQKKKKIVKLGLSHYMKMRSAIRELLLLHAERGQTDRQGGANTCISATF
jgi:hypothetical protein